MSLDPAPSLSGFTSQPFTHAIASPGRPPITIEHHVYASDNDGPAVLLMHELPGMTPECVDFARALAAAGYRVYMPLFFGTPNQRANALELAYLTTFNSCIRREFKIWSAGQSGPIVDWLIAVIDNVIAAEPHQRVGVIGMCLTGNYAVSLIVAQSVVCGVLSQPSLPIKLGPFGGPRNSFGMSDDELQKAKTKAQTLKPPCLLGFRFRQDRISPAEKMAALKTTLGEEILEVNEYPSTHRKDHSVLTYEGDCNPGSACHKARTRTFEFLDYHLRR